MTYYKKTDRWIRTLRDADRTSRLGIGCIIELAWYCGYRDQYIANIDIEQILKDRLLFDNNLPTNQDEIEKYDEKPRQYFDTKILPWLVENNKLQQLINGIHVWSNRIYGIAKTTRRGHTWKVEPVSKEAQLVARPRILSMNRFLKDNNFSEITLPESD